MKKYNSLFEAKTKPEEVIDLLKKARDVNYQYIYPEKGGKMMIDAQTANMLLLVYDKLTREDMKDKFKRMLTTSKITLLKVVDFGWKKVR